MAKPPKFWTIDGEGIFVKMDGVVKGVGEAQVRKTVFLSRLYYRNDVILPRQARDKHRESSTQKQTTVFLQDNPCATVLSDGSVITGTASGALLLFSFFVFFLSFDLMLELSCSSRRQTLDVR